MCLLRVLQKWLRAKDECGNTFHTSSHTNVFFRGHNAPVSRICPHSFASSTAFFCNILRIGANVLLMLLLINSQATNQLTQVYQSTPEYQWSLALHRARIIKTLWIVSQLWWARDNGAVKHSAATCATTLKRSLISTHYKDQCWYLELINADFAADGLVNPVRPRRKTLKAHIGVSDRWKPAVLCFAKYISERMRSAVKNATGVDAQNCLTEMYFAIIHVWRRKVLIRPRNATVEKETPLHSTCYQLYLSQIVIHEQT